MGLPTITSSYPKYDAFRICSTALLTSIPVSMFKSVFPNDYPPPSTAFLLIFVLTNSGYMFVTPILNCFTSALSDLKKPDVPNLAALYIVRQAVPINPATDIMLTNFPRFYLIIFGRNPFVIAICDMQLVFIIISQVENSALMNSSRIVTPALLITISTENPSLLLNYSTF